ncbi:hypothetical protein ACLBOM_20740 [Escherichia coli]
MKCARSKSANFLQYQQKKLASMVAETLRITVNGGEAHDQQALRLCALSSAHHDACPRRARRHSAGKRLNRRRLQRPRFLGYQNIVTVSSV